MFKNSKITILCVMLAFISVNALAGVDRDPAVVYQKHCSVCHGDHGDADTRAAGSLNPRPRNFTLPQATVELTRERMIKSVTEGRPGTGMVAHRKKLTPKEIEGVVDYIRSRFMQAGAGGQARPVASTAATSTVPGAAIYRKHCAQCHGDDGNASSWARNSLTPPPRDFTAPAARAELTLQRMIQSVTHGRPGTAMQPFSGRLGPADIEAVVHFIRANFMRVESPEGASSAQQSQLDAPSVAHPHQGPAAIPMDSMSPGMGTTTVASPGPADMKLPFPNKLRGNAKSGEAFYMHNCIVCHGANGDGNGPRAYFISPRPRNFTAEQSRVIYNRPALFDAVTHGKRGTVMPAWGKVLDQQQIADVAEFVFQAYIKAVYKPAASDVGDTKKKMN